jgi:hypothetical protein
MQNFMMEYVRAVKKFLNGMKNKTNANHYHSLKNVLNVYMTVKYAYHIMCRPCAFELKVCVKYGKKEVSVVLFNKKTGNAENNQSSNNKRSCRWNEESDDDLDFDNDSDDNSEVH